MANGLKKKLGKWPNIDVKKCLFFSPKKLLPELQKWTKRHCTEMNDPSNRSSGQALVRSGP